MHIWDRGRYETHKMRDVEVIVTFHGDRVRGRYALFQTDDKNWMIHRMDPPEDPDREPMPAHIEPMLATLSKNLPPDEDRYGFEVKWDGVRSIAYVDGGQARFESRRGGNITSRYPSCAGSVPRWVRRRRCSTARSSRSTARARASSGSSAACTSATSAPCGG
jgi:bifunctional non-homologous end joining protein LigD